MIAPSSQAESRVAKHLLLERHFLEHRLDDEIGPGDALQRLDRLDQPNAGLGVGGADPAARHAPLVIAADRSERAFEGVRVGVHQAHRNPGVGEAGGDTPAHGAGTDDGRALDGPHRCLLVDAGDLARCALREEHVAERRRFRRGHAFLEDRALLANSLIEGERQRHFDAFEARDRRPLAACLALQTLAGGREDFRILELRRALARERVRRPGGDPFLRKGERAFQQIAVDHPVENSVFGCLCGANRGAVDDHRERRLHARKPRQALGAAGAGREAQRHLRLAHLGLPARDPVVAGERHLKPAAEAIAGERGNHRLGGLLDCRNHVAERRLAFGPRLAKLANVGAGKRALARATQHHRLDRRRPGLPPAAPRLRPARQGSSHLPAGCRW